MNLIMHASHSSESTAIDNLIEISQKECSFNEVNSDIELLKWMNKPHKIEPVQVKRRSRPSTANGLRPVSARSEIIIQKMNEPKCFLMKKISIQAPCGPVLMNFIRPPIPNKLRKRSNSLKPDFEKNKKTNVPSSHKKNCQSLNFNLNKQMINRIKFGCMDISQFNRVLGK